MTHHDEGHYAMKHPPGTVLNKDIAERVQARVKDGRITCAAAHRIAGECGVEPKDVGIAIDLLEVRIAGCQLGLYGYGSKGRVVEPAREVSTELEAAIGKSLVDGRLTCRTSWDIAEQFGITRMEISAACETLKIRITSCQLGSF